MSGYIDVHCHIDEKNYGSVDALMQKISSAGVSKIIACGFDVESSEYCLELSKKYPFVYCCAGFQPTEVKKLKEGDLYKIEQLCKNEKCVALGEIGLDYHYPDTNKPLQKKVLLEQMEIAQSLNLPVVIHSRDCAEDMLDLLKQNAKKLSGGGMIHCYSHSSEMAVEFEKLGMYFSFGGTSTYGGSKRAQKSIKVLSSDRLLTETDSPYLPPKSLCGTFPNTPCSIPEILKNMANLKGEDCNLMAQTVWNNAHTLFKKLAN